MGDSFFASLIEYTYSIAGCAAVFRCIYNKLRKKPDSCEISYSRVR